MNDKTSINPITGNATVINPASAGSATVVNSAVQAQAAEPGAELPGGYVLKRRLESPAGEADIFVCERDGAEFAAKLYRRPIAVKSEVVAALQEIRCPYIAPLYCSGTFRGMPFEILPYYRSGSLRGRRFSFEELRTRLIPEINEALAALHDAGILHKDLKPSNIMLTDSGDIAVIDFGISSVQTDGSTVVVTSTGMTPEYSAPETFRGLFLEESDYYSFGITLYELFCGKTPYADMSAEDIARYTVIQSIPLPDSMPGDLRELISALTYYDITNRRRRENPNRRWTYSEVEKWCRGISQPVPGMGNAVSAVFPAYTFMDRRLGSIHEVVLAFSENWEQGKKQVFRGILSAFLKPFEPQLASCAMDAEEEAANGADPDIAFFRLLYRLDPEYRAFCWKSRRFESVTALGDYILTRMRDGSGMDDSFITEVLSLRLIQEYIHAVCPEKTELVQSARNIGDMAEISSGDPRSAAVARYAAGFVLTGGKSLHAGGGSFDTPDDLVRCMKRLLAEDMLKFEELCGELIDGGSVLDIQFEAWLIALGKGSEVESWKSSLS